jgi:hypothetical protein
MKFLTCSAWALAFLLGACGGEKKAVDPIPTELAAVETAAETGFDGALNANTGQMAAAAKLAASSWATYTQRATADGVPSDALAAASAAITAVNGLVSAGAPALAVARAFNVVSAPMARIYAVYKPPVPATLLDLDYLGRELHLDARAGDMRRASTNLDTLTAQWTAFRPAVLAAGGAAEAARLDGTLNQARSAITANNAAALEQAAMAQADAVDVIEQLFASLDAPD